MSGPISPPVSDVSLMGTRMPQRDPAMSHSRARPLPAPNTHTAPSILQGLLPSAPASPPTPAPSPTPQQRTPVWEDAADEGDTFLRETRARFSRLASPERQRFLAELLDLCDSQQLSFVRAFVSPRLKRDPFIYLPNELCLRVLSFIDDPKTLARASQVSTRWRDLLSDDMAWKHLCEKDAYRPWDSPAAPATSSSPSYSSRHAFSPILNYSGPKPAVMSTPRPRSSPHPLHSSVAGSYACAAAPGGFAARIADDAKAAASTMRARPEALSYRAKFKRRYQIETAWRHGGRVSLHSITPNPGVVTSLHLTPKYIIVALDNARIHVFRPTGEHHKTLIGHVMGVWAMVPYGDILVTGGCDRDVRVWDMSTGESKFVLRGHTSTVRCLKMSPHGYAISGSRDMTLRVWNIQTGMCRNVLVGHQSSVRCLDIHGDLVVSGSYDATAKIWSISQGRCLRTLAGHFSQIYAIAFDGVRIATGSLDTNIRIWDPSNGHCLGVLQGHTSLVAHLQMRGNTLVTGSSDGSIRVWCLQKMVPFHRMVAHDNSVTSLQFDDARIISGGCDGRVKIWDIKTGMLVRELGAPAEAVWRVAFEEERAVVLALRRSRTVMEVWSFTPPDENITAVNEGAMTSLVGEEDRGAMTPVEDEDEDEEDEDDGVDDGRPLDEEEDDDGVGDENADPRAPANAARGRSGSQPHATVCGDKDDDNKDDNNNNNNVLKVNVGNMAAIDDGGVGIGAIGGKSSSSSPATGDGHDDGISATTNTITSKTGSSRGVSTPDLGDGTGGGGTGGDGEAASKCMYQ